MPASFLMAITKVSPDKPQNDAIAHKYAPGGEIFVSLSFSGRRKPDFFCWPLAGMKIAYF
ncbi:hypothetical protein EJP617_28870 [Erwinia sp. Ejp617]|nr:hypothetical protein EJP617_28870 [Erwinia sp. Ejp617]